MTLGEIYRRGKKNLDDAQKESPAFDAGCLFEKAFGLDRQERILQSSREADAQKVQVYFSTVRERAAGRPLQYILGEWPFLDFTLKVGEGVLIPREETELLVRTAAEMLKNVQKPKVADLCSGTGAVALGLAELLQGAEVAAVEKYPQAMCFLRKNIEETKIPGVTAVEADVLSSAAAENFSSLDGIVSNPPYVCRKEISGLQEEVRQEPCEALDGGEDGLMFYRAIAKIWLPKLKPGGIAAVEIGEEQAQAVAGLFSERLNNIRVLQDFSGLDRVVCGLLKKA